MTTPIPGVVVNTVLNPLAPSTAGVPGVGVPCFAKDFNQGPTTPTLVRSWIQFTQLFGSFAQAYAYDPNAYFHNSVYQFFNNNGTACYCVRIPNTDAVAAYKNIASIAESDPVTDILVITANTPGAWGDNISISLTTAGSPQRWNLNVYVNGSSTPTETFPSLSINPADSRNVVSVVNSPISGSKYVTVATNLPSGGYVSGTDDPTMTAETALTSGSDGSSAPVIGTAIPAAFNAIQDTILYLNVPGLTNNSTYSGPITTINDLVTWADSRGDTMLIIDSPVPSFPETSAQAAANAIDMVSGGSVVSADANATIYSPWLYVLDPSSQVPGAMRYVPPGGAVAAVWQTMAVTYGMSQSPAGVYATVNTQALEVAYTSTDLGNLNAAQINAIKYVQNTGTCVFGARTLAVGFPTRYISVQRVIQQLTQDMENLIQYAVFQPNGPVLWSSIVSTLTTYLTQQMQAGVLAGSTPATAFSVTCDDTNNTQNSAQAGVVNVTVAVALLSPAEFITITLQQLSGSAATS